MNLYELGQHALADVAELADRVERLSEMLELAPSARDDLQAAAAELRNLRHIVLGFRLSGYDA